MESGGRERHAERARDSDKARHGSPTENGADDVRNCRKDERRARRRRPRFRDADRHGQAANAAIAIQSSSRGRVLRNAMANGAAAKEATEDASPFVVQFVEQNPEGPLRRELPCRGHQPQRLSHVFAYLMSRMSVSVCW
jgi:hypothetical protein